MAKTALLTAAPQSEEITSFTKQETRRLLMAARMVRVDGLRRMSREAPTMPFQPIKAEDRHRGHWFGANGKVAVVTEDGQVWIGSRMEPKEVEEARRKAKQNIAPACGLLCRNSRPLFIHQLRWLGEPHFFSSHDLLKRMSDPDWMPD